MFRNAEAETEPSQSPTPQFIHKCV